MENIARKERRRLEQTKRFRKAKRGGQQSWELRW